MLATYEFKLNELDRIPQIIQSIQTNFSEEEQTTIKISVMQGESNASEYLLSGKNGEILNERIDNIENNRNLIEISPDDLP